MRLVVTTPTKVVLDLADMAAVSAEDATGAFGILPHHANFLTVLSPCVMVCRDGQAREHFVAVTGGVLQVEAGDVQVAALDAFAGDDLDTVEQALQSAQEAEAEARAQARSGAAVLEAAAIGHIRDYLEASDTGRLVRRRD